MSGSVSKTERITLSRDYSAFLVELSIALHRHAMYPSGHPSLEPAAAAVARRAARLFEDRDTLALGVARRQLIIEGVATDPKQPVLRRLAEALHRQHLGAVSLSRGLEAAEISGALAALSRDAEREGPLGLASPDALPRWPHLRLHPLTFDRLTLATDPTPGAAGGKAAWVGAELWIGLARAAMAGVAVSSAESGSTDATPAEPAVVAQAIDTHPRAEAYDQVIVGYLLQIAHELKDESVADTAGLRRRMARLIAELSPDTLRRLVEMGGDSVQRGRFVLDATHGMAVDAVLQIVRAAGEVSGQTVSHGLVRMLSKLAAHAEIGTEQARPIADSALREQVVRLLSDWRLIDPNPEAYTRLLQRVSANAAAAAPPNAGRVSAERPSPARVTQMSLEAGAVGPRLDLAVDRAIDEGTLAALLDLVDAPPEGAGPTVDALRSRMVTPESISRMMGQQPIDFASLDRVLPSMPVESFNPLLDTLATSPDLTTRRRLLDRLSGAEADIGSLITARLYDDRWYVQRNMLALLERSGRAPAGFSAATWAESLDARVRHQAIRFQLTLPNERDQAIRAALSDGEPRLVRLGLVELQRSCPRELAPLVIALAENPEIDEDRRQLAVHALGRCRAGEALDALLRMIDGGKTLLGRPKLAPRTPLVVAAVRALTGAWSGDSRAAAMLTAATNSSDPEIREAAGASRPS